MRDLHLKVLFLTQFKTPFGFHCDMVPGVMDLEHDACQRPLVRLVTHFRAKPFLESHQYADPWTAPIV